MSTLLDARTDIAARLQDPTFNGIPSSSIDSAINTAVIYYKNRHYWFNEAKATITLTLGNGVVPNIPTDFLSELPNGGLSIAYSNIIYPIKKVSSEIFDNQSYNGQGIPFIYVYRAQQFEIYYLPSIAYSLILRYLKDYPLLVNTTDTNDFLAQAYQMIIYNALSRLYAEYKQSPTMEAYYTQRADDEEQFLKRRSGALTGTGSLTISSQLVQ